MDESKTQCSTSCNGHCASCEAEEEQGCPVCGNVGFFVPFETVESLTQPLIIEQVVDNKDGEFSLCLNKGCPVAYYSGSETKILVNQVKVPIWFKKEKDEYMVCYCRRIILEDIIEAVKSINKDEIAISDVLRYLNKEDVITDCLHNNPTGICCDRLFESAIKYALDK